MPAIIVIDDRPAKRRQLLELAQSVAADAAVEGFSDPRSALEVAGTFPPDLVIIGRTLPTLNGVRAIRRFRRLPECGTVPVVVVGDPDDRRIRYRALEGGASDVMAEPLDQGEFLLRARNLIELYAGAKAQRMRADLLERSLAAKERRFRNDLSATRDSLRGIVDTVPAMVSVADRDGNYVFVNQYMAGFYGLRPEDAIGVAIDEVLGDEQGESERAANAEVFRGSGTLSGYEEEITDAKGIARTFLSTKSALRDANRRVVNIVTVSQDITFRKWAEAELRQSKNAAEAASRVKTEFLANVSHELRTPLNAIIGFADGILEGLFGEPDIERYRDYASDISQSARHLKGIIDDILDMVNIDSGKLAVDAVETDLAATVWQAVAEVEAQAKGAEVTLHVEQAAGDARIAGDESRLRQILVNLLANAVRFSPEGGSVRVSIAEDADGGVRISVRDSGHGIDAVDLPVATDRFGRLFGDPMSNPASGMGLGLPLSIGLADLLGGRIEIDSRKGAGTQVDLIFPSGRLIHRDRLAG